MASEKVELCLKKKTYPEHKYSVTFVSKVGTKTSRSTILQKFMHTTSQQIEQFQVCFFSLRLAVS